MKSIRFLSALLSVSILFGCTTLKEPATPVDVGPPIAAPVTLDEAMGTLTISDLHGFLDGVGSVISQVSPMMGGPVIKTMLGSRFGDPQLAGIAPSNGLAVVVMNPTNVFAVAEVVPEKAASYIQGLEAMGMAVKQQGGLLLIAKSEESLVAAEPLAARVQAELLAGKRSASLRLGTRPVELIAENEEMIAGALETMLQKIKDASGSNGVMDAHKILEAELQVLLSIGRQVEAVESELLPVAGSIHVNEVIQPVEGGRLAAYCNAPALTDYHPKLKPGLLSDGVIEMEFCMRNRAALLDLFNGEITALFERLNLDPALADQWTGYMTRWIDSMGSTVCESIFTEGGQPFGFEILEDVTDEEAMMESFRNLEDDLRGMGFFRLYKKMGMPVTVKFEEAVRKVSGVKVHRLTLDYDLANVAPEQREAMEAVLGNMTFEMAIVKDVLLYTTAGGAMEELIEKIKGSSAPASQLSARDAFPSGGFYYADFDLGSYFRFITSFMGDLSDVTATLDKFTAAMEGASPIVMAGFQNSGRMKSSAQIPADLLVRFARVGQMVAMETMQKQAAQRAKQPQQEKKPDGPAPEATFNMLDGTSVELSSLKGQKVVVLDFWASWCGPCRKGLPMVQIVADHFSGRDVVFYAVNLREDAEKVNDFFEEQGLTLPVALDDGTLSKAFGVNGIPHTVVIGKDGTIKGIHTGLAADLDAQLTAEINSALAGE